MANGLREIIELKSTGHIQVRRVIKNEYGNDVYHRHVIEPGGELVNMPITDCDIIDEDNQIIKAGTCDIKKKLKTHQKDHPKEKDK